MGYTVGNGDGKLLEGKEFGIWLDVWYREGASEHGLGWIEGRLYRDRVAEHWYE